MATVMYGTGEYPGWDDNSLSKPSPLMFSKNGGNMTNISGDGGGVKCDGVVVLSLDYESATLQGGNGDYPQNNGVYFAINLNGDTTKTQGGWFFFIDTISFENISTSSTATIRLRLDKWGTCVANLSSDFSTWTTQVLATNIEVNLYQFGGSLYSNLSSYTFFKHVYPQHQHIQLIKYSDNQYPYIEQTTNENNEAFNDGSYYYLYKIVYMVTGVAGTKGANTYEKIEGGIHDVYTVQVPKGNSNPNPTFNSNLNSGGQDTLGSLVWFAPVVPFSASLDTKSGYNTVFAKGNLQTVFTFASDKDIGLIQLPFCLSNKSLTALEESYITSNYFLTNNSIFNANGTTYYVGESNDGPDAGPLGQCYNINTNGLTISDFYLYSPNQSESVDIDAGMFSLIMKYGWNYFIDAEPGSFTNGYSYQLSPALIMYPYLFNFYSYNVSYMGQTISYSIKYVNNVYDLGPIQNQNGQNSPQPLTFKFSANYPNLSINCYAQDNVIGNSNTPIGQINLSTALLPNTTNPEATFETNEKKIINNSATLKNLDTANLWTSYIGSLGLNTILNPLSLIAGAINVGVDTAKINLNYSNSFGEAKQYELAHQNTLQTAGDNLGNPDNVLTWYQMVPALNDLQTIIATVDKYGYPYNQWTRFNNLFANYYHNYIKLSQNADLLVNQNAILLIKDGQNYLIEQFINGVVIGENTMPDGSISFMDTGQLYNDCMNGKENYWNLNGGDQHYHANFKVNHQVSNLTLEAPKFQEPIITPKKEQNPTNQKEMALNKARKIRL